MAAATEVEAVDFDLDDDDLMDEDGAMEHSPAPVPRLRSTIAGGGGADDDAPRKTKGRGFREDPNSSAPRDSRLAGVGRSGFDALASDGGPGPVRCKSLSCPPPCVRFSKKVSMVASCLPSGGI
jgi:RNA-binding protein 8A